MISRDPMPTKGYATVGLKPAILTKLQKQTDEYYPGMFLPSALIIIMNEIKRGFYSTEMHPIKIDFSGGYTSCIWICSWCTEYRVFAA